MRKTIWFDMDGTIADLYAVDNWLPRLRAADPTPYTEAAVMLNMSVLARYLHKLQQLGYWVGIISWASKNATKEYDNMVAEAKRQWLSEHLPSVEFDFTLITAYGIPKEQWMNTDSDILFDDNEEIREAWNGEAYEPTEILSVLKELIHKG
jgi:5'(3')-deoxyribonucleotidase